MNRKVFLPLIVLSLMSLNVVADVNNEDPTSTNSRTTQNEQGDAIDVILKDHNQVRHMIKQLNKNLNSNISESRTIFAELKTALIKHETMEQKVWYPELEKYNDLKDIISKLKKEEQDASNELKNIDEITDDKKWMSKVKTLIKNVKHHAHEEETKLFPKVRKELNKSLLNQIGDKIRDYKKQQ